MSEFTDANSFAPSHVIVLSELPPTEKEMYYDLLLKHGASIYDDVNSKGNQQHIANVRILAPGIKKVNEDKKGKGSKRAVEPAEKMRRVANTPLEELKAALRPITLDGGGGITEELDLSAYPRFSAYLTPVQSLGDSGIDQKVASSGKVTPKKRPLVWVMKLIEDIYDSRYTQDIADLQKEEGAIEQNRDTNLFPIFVIAHISKRYGLKSLVDQTAWDLLYSVSVLRKDSLEIEIFARFLQEQYDADDILFFMYLRNVTQKILGMQFKSRWSSEKMLDSRSSQQQLWLSYRECVTVARTVFGNDGEDEADVMYRDFLSNIETQVVGQKKKQGTTTSDTRRIEVTQLFHLAVDGYHHARPEEDSSTATGFTAGTATPRTVDQVLDGSELEDLFQGYKVRMQSIEDADDKAGTQVDDRLKTEIRQQEMEKALRQMLEHKAGFDMKTTSEDMIREWAAQMLQIHGELIGGSSNGVGVGSVDGSDANESAKVNSYLESIARNREAIADSPGGAEDKAGFVSVREKCEQEFVDKAMVHAEGLSEEVIEQIRDEVMTQLKNTVEDKLNALGDLSNLRDSEMEMVMERILAAQGVGDAVESLVSVLTNYAKNHPDLS